MMHPVEQLVYVVRYFIEKNGWTEMLCFGFWEHAVQANVSTKCFIYTFVLVLFAFEKTFLYLCAIEFFLFFWCRLYSFNKKNIDFTEFLPRFAF
jgi:hypothetical protein